MRRRWTESGARFCALIAAALVQAAPAVLVAVCPRMDQVQGLIGDLSIFSAAEPARFPVCESLNVDRMVQDEAIGDRVRALKSLLGPNPPKVLVTCMPALLQPVPSRARLAQQTRTLRTGDSLSLDEIASWLVSNGYQNTTAVELPGEFARRGGIIDLYAPDWFQPVRIELFGDEIESIRPFEVESQRSRERLESVDVTAVVDTVSEGSTSSPSPPAPLPEGEGSLSHLADYLPPQSWFLLVEPGELESEGRQYLERVARPQDMHSVADVIRQATAFPSVTAAAIATGSLETTCRLQIESVERFSGDINKVRDELDDAGARPGGVSHLPDRGRSPPPGRSLRPTHARPRRPIALLHRRAAKRLSAGAGSHRAIEQRRAVSPRRLQRPAAGRRHWAGRSTASSNCAKAIWSSMSATASPATAA